MQRLTKEEHRILSKGIADIQRDYTQGLLPEQKKLLDEQFKSDDSPGYHIHDEDNPTGMHRHAKDNEIDGAHRHTIINSGGEHAHGLLEGQALIDGTHNHDGSWDLGWHHHKVDKSKDDGLDIILEQKPSIL